MAITVLTEIAKEKSTYTVSGTFYDEDDVLMTPDTLTWSLSTVGGTIIHSREAVSVVSPASTTTVVLSGLDLALFAGEDGVVLRRFTWLGTYTSSHGSGLPLRDECQFNIQGLVNVS